MLAPAGEGPLMWWSVQVGQVQVIFEVCLALQHAWYVRWARFSHQLPLTGRKIATLVADRVPRGVRENGDRAVTVDVELST